MNTIEEKYVVYAVVDPRSDEVCYVGQTKRPNERARRHRLGKTHGNVRAWERRLISLGLEPVFRVLEDDLTVSQIDERESYWIAKGLALGWPLLNLLDGSIGYIGGNIPSDVRQKISETMKENWADAEFHEEQTQRIRKALADPKVRARLSKLASERDPMSDETRTKISQTVSELWENPEYREKQVQAHLESSHTQWQDEDFRETHKEAMNKPETKAKISQKAKEMWADPEIRAKLVAERRSRGKLSDEHRAKIAAGVKRNWEKRRQRKSKQKSIKTGF